MVPMQPCEVCGGKSTSVRASSMGPMSFVYCQQCLTAGLEPYGALVGGLAFCGSGGGELTEDMIQPYMLPSIKASLAFRNKTWQDLQDDVREVEEDYAKQGNGEGGGDDG